MDIISEITTRRSVRKYTRREVSDADVTAVLEAARLAPSGHNNQPWRFLVIRDAETKKRVARADNAQEWMLDAPVFIACLGDLRSRITSGELPKVDEETPGLEIKRVVRDTSIAVGYMLLEAEHLGLSTCWTGWFLQEEMREALRVPDNFFVVGVVALGYGDESPKMRPRKSLDEIVRYERWE